MTVGKFGDFYIDVTKKGTKIPQEKYLDEGKYPVIDQGQKEIAGWWDSDDGLFRDVPAIIFGDHTRTIKYVTEPFFIGADGVKVLLPVNESDNPKYLYYALQAARIPNLGYSRHFKVLKELDIRTYPRTQQDEIVSILEMIDNTIKLRNDQLASLDLLVKSKYVEMFGNPASNPMCWDECLLGERCEIITGNTPSRADEDNYGNYIEWIKSDNINTPNTYLTAAEEYLSEKGAKQGRIVGAGSVLMTCIAGSIGCIGNVAIADRKVAFNQQINAIVPTQDEPLYIYWLMQLSKPYIQSTINMSLKGILSKGKLSQLDFPFPPVKLQKEFSDFVRINEKTKSAVQKSINELETLKKSLMQEYFE